MPPFLVRKVYELAIRGADVSGYPNPTIATLAADAGERNRIAQDLAAASGREPPEPDDGDLPYRNPSPVSPYIARTYRALYDLKMQDNRRQAHDGTSSRSREALSPWDGSFSWAGRAITTEVSDAHDTYGGGSFRPRIKIFLGTEDYSRETALVINGRLDRHVITQWAVGQDRHPGPQASGDAVPGAERTAKSRAKKKQERADAPPPPRRKNWTEADRRQGDDRGREAEAPLLENCACRG